MQREIGKEYANRMQREAFLKDNCDKVEEKGYMKPFTPEELQGSKESLANVSIQIDEIEERKKEVAKEFKAELEPLVDERKEMVSKHKAKKPNMSRKICFKFVDQESKENRVLQCRW